MCPECQKQMVAFELEGVEIDRCLSCGGTWLDAGELELLAEFSGTSPGALTRAMESAGEGKRGQRKCPRCRRKLRVVSIGQEELIEIDRCPRGDGLWLDKGEMEAVIASFTEGEEGAVATFFSQLYRKELESEQGSQQETRS